MFLAAVIIYFTQEKNLWWFACMLSGIISCLYIYFELFKKIEQENFVNYIVSIFLVTCFLISFGLSIWQGGTDNIPIILCGINGVIWLFFSLYYHKKLS